MAFDSVWHYGLFYKHQSFEFGRETCRLVGEFHRGMSFKVRVGDKVSEQQPVLAALPQGSLLGPILYNICVSDVPAPPVRGLRCTCSA